MNIASIMPEVLLPEREFVIGKHLLYKEKPVLIASITQQAGIIRLWVFQQVLDKPLTDASYAQPVECVTNRDEMQNRALYARVDLAHFSSIAIQGFELPISQSFSGIIERDTASHMRLQHFVETGVDLKPIEDISFDELALGGYQVKEGIAFPEIDTNSDIPISIKMSDASYDVVLEPPHRFGLKIGEHEISRSFTGLSISEEIKYYINRVVCYDIWGETERQMNDENTLKVWREHGLDEEAIKQALSSWPEMIETICPKGNELLVLEYECTDNRQLMFYTTEYLDSFPDNTSSSTAIFLSGSDKGMSRHGYDVRACLLKAVPAGYDAVTEVELMAWVRTMPGETLEA